MAEAAIVSAVIKKLANLVINEVDLLGGVNRKIDEVKLQLGQMQSFLKDADSKISKGDDERVKGWVRDVRNITYDTEDAIDEFLVETNSLWFGRISNGPLARRTLAGKIAKIQRKLRIVLESRITFGIQDLSEDRNTLLRLETRIKPFHKHHVVPDIDNVEVVGFEAEKRDIVGMLLHEPNDHSRHVVCIVGPGGLGKTTLAQKVYSCSTVRSHFDSTLWITVSQDFNLFDVLKNIHQKLADKSKTQEQEESRKDQVVWLLGEVNTLLKNRKYLIVLDDVWSEDVFTQLETSLVDVGNGSRVLMTSRFINVANCADSSGIYHLRFLNEGESIELLLKKALRSRNPSPKCPEELSDLASKLVKRCGGLPLPLIVLGGLLSRKPPTYQEWYRVHNRLDWHVIGQDCMKVLATSYDDLPYFLKSCFRYIACFPEDHKIRAKPLTKMWIAEGLVETQEEEKLEDFAEDYLEDLAQRCLVQVVERSTDSTIKSIQIHDLLREIALAEATTNDFLLIWKDEKAKRDVRMTRRVAFHESSNSSTSLNLPKDLTKINMPKLRTFMNFDQRDVISLGFLLLRVLELKNTQSFKDLPPDLKNMIPLRYLGLRGTGVSVIPTWISQLQNLQTLDIRGTEINKLPELFWEIISLRHVHSSALDGSVSTLILGPPPGVNLVNLRSLGRFVVPKSWMKGLPHFPCIRKLQLCCHDKDDGMLIHDLLSKLNSLLSVRLDKFNPPGETIDLSASPSYQSIHTMYLSGYEYDDLGWPQIVQIARMPPNLTSLTLTSFHLIDDPMPKLEKLRSLKYLELYNIPTTADTMTCSYGGFPQLQTLKLDNVPKVKAWKVEHGALPVLKNLLVMWCYGLRALPDLRCVTTLQELRINGPILSKIKRKSGEEWYKVEHIPTIT